MADTNLAATAYRLKTVIGGRLRRFNQRRCWVVICHRLEPTTVQDLDARVVCVDTAIAEIDDDLLRCSAGVLEQDARLLELRSQDVSVLRVSGEGVSERHKPAKPESA